MRKTYGLFKKIFPIICVELFLTALFGFLSFLLYYNTDTYSLNFPTVITCIFFALILITIITSCYLSVKSKAIRITKIKKDSGFLKFAAYFSATIIFVGFIYDFCGIILRPESFSVFRIFKFLLSISLCAYFIISVFPKRIKKHKVQIPRWIKYTLSVCSVFWGIMGIFTVYFLPSMLTNEIARISQILIYVTISIFFVFEAELEHLYPKFRVYILSAFTLMTIVVAFPVPILFLQETQRFSVIETMAPIAIGLYAFARMLALMQTMKKVINEYGSDGFSSKFRHRNSKTASDTAEHTASENAPQIKDNGETGTDKNSDSSGHNTEN